MPRPTRLVNAMACRSANVSMEDRSDLVHLRELVLLPEFQQRGIGIALLRQVMTRAQHRGVSVQLGTLHANRAAALYRRPGFREIGRTDTQILFEWFPPVRR